MSSIASILKFSQSPDVLCIGAHCDDIEIGCSGTILRLLELYPKITIKWLVLTGDRTRQDETRNSAKQLMGESTCFELIQHEFRDGHLPYTGSPVKEAVEATKARFNPDLVLCHWEGDRHQDHRFVSELAWSTFRDNLILEYEIPKFDGDIGRPNVLVPLSEEIMDLKVRNLMENYRSQTAKQWFDIETFKSMHRLRGIEAHSNARYAEGFHCRKLTLLG